ncbi:MAG: hypothetical protein AB7I27_00560 [Bacteriovoracaceae bacterium]
MKDVEQRVKERAGYYQSMHRFLRDDIAQTSREAYSQGQKDLMEECGEGFDEWQYETESLDCFTPLKEAWQASALKSRKEIDDLKEQLKERDEKIASLMSDLEWDLRIVDYGARSGRLSINYTDAIKNIKQRHFDGKGE